MGSKGQSHSAQDMQSQISTYHGFLWARAEQDLLEILDLELFRVKILVLILLDAF